MNIVINHYTIPVGAKKEFSVYHMSDNHICLADERDNERKNLLAKERANAFTNGHPELLEEMLICMLEEVRRQKLPLIHTGDLIDFTSCANFDYARQCIEGLDVIMAVGNHEFSQYVGEAFEDEAYKEQSIKDVLASLPDGCMFGSRVIEGVKFITLDNCYYYITPPQLEYFREVLSDGLPVVLVMHTPLYSSDLYRQIVAAKGVEEPPYLCGCPQQYLRHLSEARYRQQAPDETTLQFLGLCKSAPNLKAVLAGHLHATYVSSLDSGIPQYVVEGGFNGVMNKYIFV